MDKKITLVDFARERKVYTIKDFENVFTIEIKIMSGDEIAKIFYKDGKIIKVDSSDCRYFGYYDGEYILQLDKVDEFSSFIGSSYERQRKFDSNSYIWEDLDEE